MSVRAILYSTLMSIVVLLAACGEVGSQIPERPLLYGDEILEEMHRIQAANEELIPALIDFNAYPIPLGIDGRNGFTLLEDYICWNSCPGVGALFLIYQDVPSKWKCEDAGGTVINSPVAIPGVEPDYYFGCVPKTG